MRCVCVCAVLGVCVCSGDVRWLSEDLAGVSAVGLGMRRAFLRNLKATIGHSHSNTHTHSLRNC